MIQVSFSLESYLNPFGMNFLDITADIVFLVGQEEERIYSHRLILKARCKSFQIKEGASISGI